MPLAVVLISSLSIFIIRYYSFLLLIFGCFSPILNRLATVMYVCLHPTPYPLSSFMYGCLHSTLNLLQSCIVVYTPIPIWLLLSHSKFRTPFMSLYTPCRIHYHQSCMAVYTLHLSSKITIKSISFV